MEAVVVEDDLRRRSRIRVRAQSRLVVAVRCGGCPIASRIIGELQPVCRTRKEGCVADNRVAREPRRINIELRPVKQIAAVEAVVLGQRQHRPTVLRNIVIEVERVVREFVGGLCRDVLRADVECRARSRIIVAVERCIREVRRVGAVLCAEVDDVPRRTAAGS